MAMNDSIYNYPELKKVPNLTPESAKEKGYEWHHDDIYDREAPVGAMDEFAMMEQKGLVFGEPVTPDGESMNMVGVYKRKQG